MKIEINKKLSSNEMMISIGQRVKDLVSGLIGTSITRCVFLNGCIQHEVQPNLDNGEIQKTVWIDESQLKVVHYENSQIQKITMGNDIKLGYLFKDIITNLEGIAIAYAEHYSGLKEYEIQPLSYDGKGRQPIWIPKKRLIKVSVNCRGFLLLNGGGQGGGHRNHP